MVPPIKVNTGNTQADDQHTTIIEVHVDEPRCCALCRLRRPNTTNTLEQNGSSKWMAGFSSLLVAEILANFESTRDASRAAS